MERRALTGLLFSLFAVALSCCGGSQKSSRASVGCDRETIKYQEGGYNERQARELFKAGGAGQETQAARGLSNLVLRFFGETANLCDAYVNGGTSELEYSDRLARLTERFAALVELNRAFPASQVQPVETSLYLETLSNLEPDAKATAVDFGITVVGAGREIRDGAVLFEGDEIRLVADVRIMAYLYVFMIDSSGSLSIVYPTSFVGAENPVRGRVEIPSGENVLVLDDNAGKERFIAFVETGPSKAIEKMLTNLNKPGADRTLPVAQILLRAAQSRMSLTTSRSQKDFYSKYGRASTIFEIEHR